jgi:hypothetical protein
LWCVALRSLSPSLRLLTLGPFILLASFALAPLASQSLARIGIHVCGSVVVAGTGSAQLPAASLARVPYGSPGASVSLAATGYALPPLSRSSPGCCCSGRASSASPFCLRFRVVFLLPFVELSPLVHLLCSVEPDCLVFAESAVGSPNLYRLLRPEVTHCLLGVQSCASLLGRIRIAASVPFVHSGLNRLQHTPPLRGVAASAFLLSHPLSAPCSGHSTCGV